jgi:extradiol dioxygenase family protein
MASSFSRVVPVLRMFDLAATRRFYCDYLGCNVDWQEGDGDGPIYLQVSREDLVLQLSSHHGDGTPGTAVIIYTEDLSALHSELQANPYPFLAPGIEAHGAGRVMTLVDPASNLLRFFERA